MDGNKFFGSVQFVPGVGYIQGGAGAALGDDSSVMMISGLGVEEKPKMSQSYSGSSVKPLPGFADLTATLKSSFRIFGIALPLWFWLLLGAGTIGAGVFFWKKGKF